VVMLGLACDNIELMGYLRFPCFRSMPEQAGVELDSGPLVLNGRRKSELQSGRQRPTSSHRGGLFVNLGSDF
jgi:hypothetical protein